MASISTAVAAPHASSIRISLADCGGWALTIEWEGRPPVTERYDDWHRVERRVAVLEGAGRSIPSVRLAGRTAQTAVRILMESSWGVS